MKIRPSLFLRNKVLLGFSLVGNVLCELVCRGHHRTETNVCQTTRPPTSQTRSFLLLMFCIPRYSVIFSRPYGSSLLHRQRPLPPLSLSTGRNANDDTKTYGILRRYIMEQNAERTNFVQSFVLHYRASSHDVLRVCVSNTHLLLCTIDYVSTQTPTLFQQP